MVPVESVKVSALDQEHQECVEAYNELITTKTLSAVGHLRATLQRHFEHEEGLLDTHLYAGLPAPTAGFSSDGNARSSHFADHARMLAALSAALDSGWSEVPPSFINKIMLDFERHARMYDNNYADRLSSALG